MCYPFTELSMVMILVMRGRKRMLHKPCKKLGLPEKPLR